MTQNLKNTNDLVTYYLYKLPGFIQKGNKRCNLKITKQAGMFIVSYSNSPDFYESGEDIEKVLEAIINKLKNPPSDKYIIH